MRTAFIDELARQARLNPEVFLIVGDLGYSVVEPFAAEFPERFLNAGVAEQNMTGVAAGLASEGWHVFTYSIANFPTLRCLEQIRNDICYHSLPVTVVSVGAGLAYGALGYSHHAVQDIGILRTLPGMKVLSPADPGETRECLRHLVENPGPSYLRLGKAGEKELYDGNLLTDKPVIVVSGNSDLAILATGSVLDMAIEAANLAPRHLKPTVFSMPWLAPVNQNTFTTCMSGFKKVVALHEHVSEGGLGDVLRSCVPRSVEIVDSCLNHSLKSEVGSQSRLRAIAGMDAERLIADLLQSD